MKLLGFSVRSSGNKIVTADTSLDATLTIPQLYDIVNPYMQHFSGYLTFSRVYAILSLKQIAEVVWDNRNPMVVNSLSAFSLLYAEIGVWWLRNDESVLEEASV